MTRNSGDLRHEGERSSDAGAGLGEKLHGYEDMKEFVQSLEKPRCGIAPFRLWEPAWHIFSETLLLRLKHAQQCIREAQDAMHGVIVGLPICHQWQVWVWELLSCNSL